MKVFADVIRLIDSVATDDFELKNDISLKQKDC
jgi:hypothetical protein